MTSRRPPRNLAGRRRTTRRCPPAPGSRSNPPPPHRPSGKRGTDFPTAAPRRRSGRGASRTLGPARPDSTAGLGLSPRDRLLVLCSAAPGAHRREEGRAAVVLGRVGTRHDDSCGSELISCSLASSLSFLAGWLGIFYYFYFTVK